MGTDAAALSDADAALVIAATGRIWPPGEDFRDAAAREILALADADVVAFNRLNWSTGVRELIIEPDTWREPMLGLQESIEPYIHQHPLINHLLEGGDVRALWFFDAALTEQWRATDLYHRYYEPLGLQWQMVLPIPSGDEYINVISLNRRTTNFTRRDAAVCEALLPILALGCGGAPNDIPLDTAAGWLLVQTDADGVITRVSPPDHLRTLKPGRPLTPGEELPTSLGGVARFCLGGHDWMARRVGGADLGAIVAIRPATGAADLLATLTERQREVLALVAAGHTNKRIGSELGIALGTVRKHVEHIMADIGVPNRAAAAALWQAARDQE